MGIKLLAFDLDGTALVEHKILPRGNLNALMNAGEKGIMLVPATGRIRSFIPEVITDIPYVRYAITANGGGVYDLKEDKLIHSACIPMEKSLEIQAILDEYQLYTEYYVGGSAYGLRCTPQEAVKRYGLPESKLYFLTKTYTYTDSFKSLLTHAGALPEKINLPFIPPEHRVELRQRLAKIPSLSVSSSIADNLEINDIAATKGQGLKALCKILGIELEDCMAIGDNGNDTDMLSSAGVSVAMGNASEEALKAAKFHTLPCDQEGLARAIERHAI